MILWIVLTIVGARGIMVLILGLGLLVWVASRSPNMHDEPQQLVKNVACSSLHGLDQLPIEEQQIVRQTCY